MAFNLASKSVFFIKLLSSSISFLIIVNAELAANPLISGNLFSAAVKADL